MKPDPRFIAQPKVFWANVLTISQQVGYTARGTSRQIKVPSLADISAAFSGIGLNTAHIADVDGNLTPFGKTLLEYFQYRANILNEFVRLQLMDKDQAKLLFEKVKGKRNWKCPLPMNKQTGSKKAPAFLTGMVNMLIENNSEGMPCDFDPRGLTTVTQNGTPLRTFARRVDGAFPNTINPVAIWEIKEYYYTTTFGSRVADGVYETLLDGMELEELRERESVDVKHYLIIDAYYTWWDCGRSYLCRIIDMLHMGYIDEVLFGKEIVGRLPALVKEWVAVVKKRNQIN